VIWQSQSTNGGRKRDAASGVTNGEPESQSVHMGALLGPTFVGLRNV
jgi:hypothetical protein